MNTSPISNWEGVEAYFTFGPNSLGMYIFLVLALALFVGFIVRMIVHENHNFARVREMHARTGDSHSSSYAAPASAGNSAPSSEDHDGRSNENPQEREGVLYGAKKS